MDVTKFHVRSLGREEKSRNDAFRNCKEDLAWGTEIWIVTNPDHMIHRNGFRFMGPCGNLLNNA